MVRQRGRVAYGLGMVLVTVGGLLWRSSLVTLPAPVSKYGADGLWALLVFLGGGFLFPRLSTGVTATLAIAFSFAVETSQLYHAPWIDAVRATRLGALELGSVFNWPDFVAYAVGIGIGAAAEARWQRTVPEKGTKR